MNGFNDNPAFLNNNSSVDDQSQQQEWEVLDENGEWVTLDLANLDESELEQLRLGKGLGNKFPRPKRRPSKPGKPKPGTGGTSHVLSEISKGILNNFVAPIAVGLAIDAITGEEVLQHPKGSKQNEDGSVTYPDGSIAKKDNTITHPDASVSAPTGVTTYPDGRTFNSNTGVMTFPDGTEAQGVKTDGKWIFPKS